MLTLNDSAREELEEYFADKDATPIRIFLAGGCGGPRLALALDEPTETDTVFNEGKFTFVVDKELLETTGSLTIDANARGFAVTSENPIASSGGGCGGCSGCGGDR